MRYRVLLVAAGLLTASASIYGQAKLAGKWQTDYVPAALEAQKNAPAAPEGGAKGGGGRGGGQAIMLDLQVDASGKNKRDCYGNWKSTGAEYRHRHDHGKDDHLGHSAARSHLEPRDDGR